MYVDHLKGRESKIWPAVSCSEVFEFSQSVFWPGR